MPLSKTQLDEIQEYAERYVGAFVKCNGPNSEFTVSGKKCDTLERAVALALDRCGRPHVDIEDMADQELVLAICLAQAIAELRC